MIEVGSNPETNDAGSVELLTEASFLQALKARKYPAQDSYLSFYSSWLGGIVTDPSLMVIPMDDHLVHRGDGVFEAMKWTGQKIYLFHEHFQRLQRSSQRISLPLDWTESQVKQICLQVVQAALVSLSQRQIQEEKVLKAQSSPELMIRLFVSRGPGNYSTNPYDSVGSQLQVIVTRLASPSAQKYQMGSSLGLSSWMMKNTDWAPYKTCNYLANVMMKKEAVDRGLDFCVGRDAQGFLTESSTENIIILNANNQLQKPGPDFILQGTTMNRVLNLAEKLVRENKIQGIHERSFSEADLRSAREVMVVGTTWDVMPITKIETQPVGSGQPGPVSLALQELLKEDQKSVERLS